MNSLLPDRTIVRKTLRTARVAESGGHLGLDSVRPILVAFIMLVVASLSMGQAGSAAPGYQLNVAGLVIDYGGGAVTYALIPFEDDSLTGLDLLQLSGLELLSIDLGGMGTAVCAIEKVGCEYDACRGRLCQTGDPDSPYWQYLRGPEVSGEDWSYASRGASATTLVDGSVDGWLWSSNRPEGPALTIEEIAKELDVDLENLRKGSSTNPSLLTVGALTPNSTKSKMIYWELFGGVAVIAGVGAIGWFAARPVRPVWPTK